MPKTTIILDDHPEFRQDIYDTIKFPTFYLGSAQDLVNTLAHLKYENRIGEYNLLIPSHFHFNRDQNNIYLPASFNNGKDFVLERTGGSEDVIELYSMVVFGDKSDGLWKPLMPGIFIVADTHRSLYQTRIPGVKSEWASIMGMDKSAAKVYSVEEQYARSSLQSILSKL